MPRDDLLEVDQMNAPRMVGGAEAPDAHVHGLVARLGEQAREDDGLVGELVGVPATPLVRGELDGVGRARGGRNRHQKAAMVGDLIVVRPVQRLK